MIINRIWAMPNRWTFKIKPIKKLLNRYVGDGGGWIDPFSGKNSPAEITNDLDENMNTTFHMSAIEFLKKFDSNYVSGVIYDPPFSAAQAKVCYKETNLWKRNTEFYKYMHSCQIEISRIIRPGGTVISCGFNSGGIGKKYGFEIEEILLVPHGGGRNDTIVTVDKKMIKNIPKSLFDF